MPSIPRKLTVTECVCRRCSHHWFPRKEGRPTWCPGCGDPAWDQPRTQPRRKPKAPKETP